MKYFKDLRFIIGLFFLIVSGLLIIAGFTVDPSEGAAGDVNINLMVGEYMLAFAGAMMAMAVYAGRTST
jgi:hypothetical protein